MRGLKLEAKDEVSFMISEISRDELKQRLDHPKKFTLVDTLPAESYRQSHIPGALNLPLQEIRSLAPELVPSKDQEVIVYCASAACNASEEAARILEEMGYSRVRRYVGGIADWAAAAIPLASDEMRHDVNNLDVNKHDLNKHDEHKHAA
jgi:rhodanese-related sulfurtransferase